MNLTQPVVSANWLNENLNDSRLLVLDASMPKAGMDESSLSDQLIPGALFMDLKNRWSVSGAPFPNTLPDPVSFQKQARAMGVNRDSVIVVYDEHGIYSSARAWYLFRSMGHDMVAVLDGGLPTWLKAGMPFDLKTSEKKVAQPGDFNASFDPDRFKDYSTVLAELEDASNVVLDARAGDRFMGIVEEPRPGLRSGHIPNSKSLPFSKLQEEGKMKSAEALKSIFESVSEPDQALTLSCGSGITACVLALGAEIAGIRGVSVYDGSWTEWGSLPELPVEKG